MAGTLTGIIEITEHRDIRGNIERRDYRWEGPPTAMISRHLMYLIDNRVEVGDVITIGPFRSKIIEDDIERYSFLVTRMDKPFWWLRYIWHRYNKSLDLTYRRFITTLAVWRLAEYNPAAIPSWRDIYIIQKLRARLYEHD